MTQHVLGGAVAAFAYVLIPEAPLSVGDPFLGPVLGSELVPDRHVVVERYWVVDVQVLDGRGDVGVIFLEVELGRVDSDDDQSVLAIPVVPGSQVRERAN